MTPFIKKKDIKKDWYIINAQNIAVGRLASYISKVLRGKNKPTFNPHIDNGDFVVVTNIDKIKFTGKKLINKKYFRPSEVNYLLGDPTKAHKLLGWKPSISISNLIKEMMENDLMEAKKEKLLKESNI